jgi:predicted RecB family endonuclease
MHTPEQMDLEMTLKMDALENEINRLKRDKSAFKKDLKRGLVQGTWDREEELALKVNELKQLKQINHSSVSNKITEIDTELENLYRRVRQLESQKGTLLAHNPDCCKKHYYIYQQCKWCGYSAVLSDGN